MSRTNHYRTKETKCENLKNKHDGLWLIGRNSNDRKDFYWNSNGWINEVDQNSNDWNEVEQNWNDWKYFVDRN